MNEELELTSVLKEISDNLRGLKETFQELINSNKAFGKVVYEDGKEVNVKDLEAKLKQDELKLRESELKLKEEEIEKIKKEKIEKETLNEIAIKQEKIENIDKADEVFNSELEKLEKGKDDTKIRDLNSKITTLKTEKEKLKGEITNSLVQSK